VEGQMHSIRVVQAQTVVQPVSPRATTATSQMAHFRTEVRLRPKLRACFALLLEGGGEILGGEGSVVRSLKQLLGLMPPVAERPDPHQVGLCDS
jgi:hypothetical protein